jgi:transposase
MHLVGFTIEMYRDAWPYERQTEIFIKTARVQPGPPQ